MPSLKLQGKLIQDKIPQEKIPHVVSITDIKNTVKPASTPSLLQLNDYTNVQLFLCFRFNYKSKD